MNKLTSSGNLCFKEDEFLHPKFNVDTFVAKCKDCVTMSTLREDLETHYKSIQLALIELINRDYADFVSLSTNLIGTDKMIENLTTPLGQLKEEVVSVKNDISLALAKLEKKLEQRKMVRDKKSRLHHLINVIHSVEKIEKILTADPKSPDMEVFMSEDRAHPGHFLERIAGEFNQLQFHVHQSKGHPIIESIRPRVALITSKLQETLESTFEQSLMTKQADLMLRCLRTYALIDKTSHAEDLFRHLIVKPFVEEVVNEKYHSEHGTEKLCEDIIRFIDEDCDVVLTLTSEERQKKHAILHDVLQENKGQSVQGFDFMVNTVWCELVQTFMEKLPLLFSPGNPELFLKRYNVMMKFLEDFEDRCVSTASFMYLRSHPSYQSFIMKWSLPVYFQIRYQEIGGGIEGAVDDAFIKSPEELFMTNVVGRCWLGMTKCWNNNVYIPSLIGRFWKLNLQIVSRLCIFVKSIVQPIDSTPKDTSIENLSLLLGDTLYFDKKTRDYFEQNTKKFLEGMGVSDLQLYRDALHQCCNALKESSTCLMAHIVKKLSAEATLHLDNVKNVPRLYRRTNREPPVQASNYISSSFLCVQAFKDNSSTLDSQNQDGIIKSAVNEMTSVYFNAVNELLTSIKKTEDSLLRLKQMRKATSGQAGSSVDTRANEVSDETKIRKQIHLDAVEYGNQMSTLNLSPSDFADYVQLIELTSKAVELNELT